MFSPKAYFEDFISNHLDDFVVDFDKESLKIGLWNGKFELSNLVLRTQTWDIGKGLYLTMEYGSVEKMMVTVQWATLHTGGIHTSIENLQLVFRIHTVEGDDVDVASIDKNESIMQKFKMVR